MNPEPRDLDRPTPPVATPPKADASAAKEPARAPALVAGECHTCNLDGDGGVRCWGCNDHGQLGDGTFEPRGSPAPVLGLGPVRDLAVGPRGACVAEDDGAVACWGANTPYEPAPDAATPLRIVGIVDAVEVAVGRAVACARTRDGEVHCWGEDRYRRFASPFSGGVLRVDDDLAIRAIGVRVDAGDNTCVLGDDGRVLCWGPDLGEWNPPPPPPEAGHDERHTWFLSLGGPREAATGVTAFVRGAAPICVWIGEGAARRWRCLVDAIDRGLADLHAATDGDAAARVTMSAGHSCVVIGGRVRCFGDDADGQVGASTIAALTDVVDVAAGARHTCARRASGAFACWGDGARLATGDPSMTLTPAPPAPDGAGIRPMRAFSKVSDLSSGTCSIGQDGKLRCLDRARSRPAAGLRDLVEVTLGDDHTCARARGGAVHCWGAWYHGPNNHDGDESDFVRARAPRRIAGLDALAITSWGESDCAVARDGTIGCWGRWAGKPLRPTPEEAWGDGWVDVAVSTWWFCARKADGAARCRRNEHTPKTPPIELRGVVDLALASDRGCAVHDDGRVSCWGDGPSGDGTERRHDAGVVARGIGDAIALSVGDGHTCALARGGAVRCWGDNREGQLGDGTRVSRALPTLAREAPPRGKVVGVAVLAGSTVVWTDLGEAWSWGAAVEE